MQDDNVVVAVDSLARETPPPAGDCSAIEINETTLLAKRGEIVTSKQIGVLSGEWRERKITSTSGWHLITSVIEPFFWFNLLTELVKAAPLKIEPKKWFCPVKLVVQVFD